MIHAALRLLPIADRSRSGKRRDKPAQWCRVEVPDREGCATHPGPESGAGVGNGAGEALTGEPAGRVGSPASAGSPGGRRAPHTRQASLAPPCWPGGDGPRGGGALWPAEPPGVRTPGDPAAGRTHARQVRTGPLRGTTVRDGGRASASSGVSRKPAHHGFGVPALAAGVERRGLATGLLGGAPRGWPPSRGTLAQAHDWGRQARRACAFDPRQEPGAVVPHAGICAGGGG